MKYRIAAGWIVTGVLAFGAGWLMPRAASGDQAATKPASGGKVSETASGKSAKASAPVTGAAGTGTESAGGATLPGEEAALRAYVREALAEGRAFERISRVTAILAGMNRENAAAIRGEIEAVLQSGRRLITEQLLLEHRLGEVLGQEAAEAMRPADPAESPPEGFRNVISGWSGEDPVAALNWFNKLPDGKYRDEALRWVINGVCSRNMEQGKTLYDSLPPDLQLGASNQMFWNFVQSRGPEGTEPWVNGLVSRAGAGEATAEQRELAGKMVRELTLRWMKDSPAKAAAYLSRQGRGAPGARTAGVMVLQQWNRTDPAAAQQWAADFGMGTATPAGESRKERE